MYVLGQLLSKFATYTNFVHLPEIMTEKEVSSIPETEETLVKTRMMSRVKDQSRVRRNSPTPIPRTRGPSSISPAAMPK